MVSLDGARFGSTAGRVHGGGGGQLMEEQKWNGWVNGGGGFGGGWRGGWVVWSRQQYRASRWNEPKDRLLSLFIFVVVCFGGYVDCVVLFVCLFRLVLFFFVSFCFVVSLFYI